MASPRSRSRSPARSSARTRGAGSSDSSQTVVMIGAAAIAIVIILVVMMRGGSTTEASGETPAPAAAGPAQPASQPAPPTGAAKAGKTPDRPAPALTPETLARLDELLEEAKGHYNEGVKLRNAGDNMGAREEQAKAKDLLEQWEGLITDQLRWQEEADMEDWAQPAEYEVLTRKYAGFSRLQKSVRMGGGK